MITQKVKPKMPPKPDVIIEDERWNALKFNINIILESIHEHLPTDETMNFSILMVGDEKIRELNSTYRNKDKPTNVLSFPCDEIEGYIGDLIISYDTIKKECEEQDKTIIDHTTHMIIHGFLHLLEYDHIEDKDASIMENLEIKILHSLNIKNPYNS